MVVVNIYMGAWWYLSAVIMMASLLEWLAQTSWTVLLGKGKINVLRIPIHFHYENFVMEPSGGANLHLKIYPIVGHLNLVCIDVEVGDKQMHKHLITRVTQGSSILRMRGLMESFSTGAQTSSLSSSSTSSSVTAAAGEFLKKIQASWGSGWLGAAAHDFNFFRFVIFMKIVNLLSSSKFSLLLLLLRVSYSLSSLSMSKSLCLNFLSDPCLDYCLYFWIKRGINKN